MMTPYQRYISLSRYARFLPEESRRETWEETVARYCDYFADRSPEFPRQKIYESIQSLNVMPSMRALMTAGKALDRDNVAGFNCSYVIIDDVRAFDESLYILMNGCGLGFSVERQYIAKLPEISEHFFESDTVIKVRDSKIGWSTAFRELIGMLYGGKIPKWDLTALRPAGAPLKVFGGRSSGPGPLNDLFQFSVNLFKKAAGRKLNSIECHDLMCKIADVVVVGGVRRCLPSGSKVHTRLGMIDIEDIEIGDEVLTSSGYSKVSNKFDQGIQFLIRINTQDSYFDCTPNHKIAVLSGINSYIWKQASDLDIGDRIIAPSVPIEGYDVELPEFSYAKPKYSSTCKDIIIPTLDSDMAWLLGLIQGDGYVAHTTKSGYITIACTKELSNIITKARNQLERFGVNTSVLEYDNYVVITCKSKQLATYFNTWLKQPNATLHVPEFIWLAHTDIKLSYISGLMDADGSVKTRPVMVCSTVYQEYAREIQLLLSSCGVQSRLKKLSTSNLKANWQEKYSVSLINTASKTEMQKYTIKEINISSVEHCTNTFPKEFLEFSYPNNYSWTKTDSKLIPVTVIGVDELEDPTQTWDIEVEEAHEFFCNGYLMHNSALISLSNLSDDRMRHAKTGQWWIDEPQRSLANNSVAYTEKPTISQFMAEWSSLYESKSGERGLINRVAAKKKIKTLADRRKVDFDWGSNPCLTGETLVYVADGREEVSIRQLAEEGKDVDVFCFDNNQKLVIRTMRNPRITGYNMPVYKMTLDDGSVISATENHKFLTKNDGYKELKDINTGESLSIITKFEASFKDMFSKANTNSQNYWWITKNGFSKKSEHRLIAEHHYNESIPSGYVVHHKNFNAQDNSPNNLQVMTKKDHDILHGDLIRGENNPMIRGKIEWSKEKWAEYSKSVSGELNGRYSGISNDELRNHAMILTKQLNRRFSVKDWVEYAKLHNIPVFFGKWREDHLGGIIGLAKSCALELGIDYVNIDPRIIASYKIAIDAGYNAEIIDGSVIIHKNCEICGTEFDTTYSKREFGVCSRSCANKKVWQSQKILFEERRKVNREVQTKIYSDLKFKLGRDPQKKEWMEECKNEGVSCEISRKSSPFTSYDQLKDSASLYNHKVVSIEFCGNETVYNGTVDEYHNFFVGGFKGILPNGKKKLIYINNLNCGEIILRPEEFCNLTEVIIREDDTLDSLKNKVEIATILGTFQSTLTDFRYLRSIWKKNVEEERLLGVSLTGIMDHPILSNVNYTAKEWLIELRKTAIEVNKIWAEKLGINPSAAITTVKPSGTVSQLVDSSSGIHPRISKYYIRTVRNDKKDPLSDFMIASGVPYETDCIKESNWVFSFPVKSPSNCRLASEMSAIDQLEHYMMFNEYWCEHNPSITVYVREHEWIDVAAFVFKHFDNINGVSFLPYSDTIYKQAPYQPISEKEYDKIMETFPIVDFSLYNVNEHQDNTVGTQTLACVSGVCEI